MEMSPPNSPARVADHLADSVSQPSSPASFFVPDPDDIGPMNQNESLEDPLDQPDGLEDPLDEELAYGGGYGDDSSEDGDDVEAEHFGDELNVGDTMATEEIPNSTRDSLNEHESVVLDMADSNLLRGRILLLNVEDGELEAPCCCLCHQIAIDGEDLTFLLENKLRNSFVLNYC